MSGERNGIAFIGGVLSFMAMVACARQEPTYVPDELIGVWVTEAPGWEQRFLKLERRSIHFGMGDDQASSNPVLSVEQTPEEGKILYQIKFLSPEGFEYSKPLYYDPARKEITFKNRPGVVWTKTDLEVRPAFQASSLAARGDGHRRRNPRYGQDFRGAVAA